ncbi:plastocyanin/azurin family copper-binding protein [Aestuariibacter sp. AA17]|uniref:Plastocyanin/azurin family copper-binding protein n=1 Tax=Fluctibacter corallii TaxID=2984329 RepID=A0ABT3AAP4_9ALTE|nr:plastocyanin/azurin family copper-binding protein [Aestuariibacter sp. AA17]MCV2885703.1 plastocyanin/azurin family copper-binding protein [Aestuariibacter sp. AA17]
MKALFITLLLLIVSATAIAKTVEVAQKDKEFTVAEVEINKGDVVRFVNEDPFFHNVYSLSDTKLFDLGSFPKGEYRDVTFDQAGTVEVECAIHPAMKMKVIVKE